MADKVIEIKNLSFSYGRAKVLDHINLEVNNGDFFLIIGENGTGKSTLIKLILGELTPTEGQIALFGEDLSNTGLTNSNKRRKLHKKYCIGYVPQITMNSSVNFPASVEEVIGMNLYSYIGFMKPLRKKHKAFIKEAMEYTAIAHLAKKQFSELSGGQQQRVLIAKALVNAPDLLVLDEPVSGIDSETQKKLYSLLTHLNKEHGITILMITHDLETVKPYADKVFKLCGTSKNEGEVSHA